MAADPKLSKAEYELLAEFRWSIRQFLRFSEAAARAAGVTPQQHQALLAIKGFPGRDRVSMGEFAERLQLLHHSAVGLADRLAAKGYIKRETDPADRRRVYLCLTADGEAVLGRLSAAHHEQLHRLRPGLSRVLKGLRPPGRRGRGSRSGS